MPDPQDYALSVSTFIAAPPAAVWEVMTGRFAEWWCPKPWWTDVIELDWRAGGRSAMVLRGPEGEAHELEGVFLEVTPGVRWVSTDALTAGWHPAGPFMLGIWEIAPEGEGTRYTATSRHWTEDACKQHADMGFSDGWSACAAQLKALCEAGG